MSLSLVCYHDGWRERWDAFVRGHPESSYAHLSDWRQVVLDALGHACKSLLVHEEGEIRAVLPLFLVDHFLFGRFLVSTPAATSGGVLATTPEAEALALEGARTLVLGLGADYAELRQEGRGISGLPADEGFVTTVMPLDAEPAVLRKRVSNKIRRDLNRAKRDGLSVASGHEHLGGFYRQYTQRMDQLGSPPFGWSFFQTVCERFGARADVVVVRRAGDVVAANLAIHHGSRVFNLFAGAEPAARKSGAVSLFCWDQIVRACAAGRTSYDLGRSSVGSPVLKYKAYWRGETVPLRYCYVLGKADRIPDKHTESPLFRWASRVWSKLPPGVAHHLGPQVVKYLY